MNDMNYKNQFVMKKMARNKKVVMRPCPPKNIKHQKRSTSSFNEYNSCSGGDAGVPIVPFAPYNQPPLYSSVEPAFPWNIGYCDAAPPASPAAAVTDVSPREGRGDHGISSVKEALEAAESILEFDPRSLEPTPFKTTHDDEDGSHNITIVQEIKLGTCWNPHPDDDSSTTTEFLKLFLQRKLPAVTSIAERIKQERCNNDYRSKIGPVGLQDYEEDFLDLDEFGGGEQDEEDLEVAAGSCSSHKSVQRRRTAYMHESWQNRYEELLEFHKRTGHCSVPHNWIGNRPLAQWVKRQRYQYKLKQEGKHTTLTEERRKALDDIGFIWSSHRSSWEERFLDLIEFEERNGHCNVPSLYPENHQLAVWVKCQRRQMRLLSLGNKSSTMTPERITRLKELGFTFNPRKLKV